MCLKPAGETWAWRRQELVSQHRHGHCASPLAAGSRSSGADGSCPPRAKLYSLGHSVITPQECSPPTALRRKQTAPPFTLFLRDPQQDGTALISCLT